ncbi:MAG TPA: ABC transporter permease [Chitinophagaceae bacterium]|jgi:putative ABC transport system permease protein|nr:ABC transporter permease [Chitinophagaceae bacterium]
MFRNYFKIAIRNFWKNKWFSFINIFGLSLGIATCLLIMLYVQHELGFDRFNKKAGQIVRVTFHGKMNGGEIKEATVMPPVAETFKRDFPEVRQATRLRSFGKPRIAFGNKLLREDALAFVDANFFQVFTLPFLQGDPLTALQQPRSVVISSAVAKKYFGNESPLGKVIEIREERGGTFTITGVYKNIPDNSHFEQFGLLVSMSSLPEASEDTWMASNFYTYLELPKGFNYHKLEAKLPQEVDKYIGPQLQQAMGVTISQFRQSGNNIGFFLQPLTDIHLHSDLTGDMKPSGNIQYVYIFSAVAVFMLLIACINFMNLSTAGASRRLKEVGIRKVMGSVKSQLIRQFLLESLLLTTVAVVIAVVFVQLVLPAFNAFTQMDVSLQLTDSPVILPGLVLLVIIVGFLAGSYPAFYLSSFRPITVLKNKFIAGKSSAGLRSGLVVFQFIISISLMIGTIVVYQQLSYIRHKDLGYDKNQVIVVQDSYWLGKHAETFKQALLSDPRVANVSMSGYLPAGPSYNNNYLAYPDNNSTQLVYSLRYGVDENYIPVMDMHMVAGRNFSKTFGSDSTAVIINEAAASAFGWNDDAIGHTLSHSNSDGKISTYRVIGIVKNFHFKSLHDLITPLVMTMESENGTMIVKTKTANVQELLTTMKRDWDQLTSQSPFSYSFLDERFENMYRSEHTIGIIIGVFALLTIFVACLGLFGLATFTAERRTKEIGIRKVLGANVTVIVSLLSKDFLKLVIIAIAVASPVAWYVMNLWLRDFAYRIQISWWVFLAVAIAAVLIALVAVGYQAVKAAIINPVKVLRSE